MSPTERADVVVVGGGSAGSVVAARAVEAGRRVVLVEAGPDPRPLPEVIADPARQDEVIRGDLVRHYPVVRPDGSTWQLVSARVIGGGSAVNNLSILRPVRQDFEAWQAFGGPAWSYDALLPRMRAIEDDPDFGDEPHHGRGGPIRLVRPWRPEGPSDPPVAALLEAAAALGIGSCPDPNVAEPLGVCGSPYNLVDGRRLTVAAAYLDPVRDRPGLVIRAGTTARRLVVEGSRVVGVEVSGPDGSLTIAAERTVLAAGSYQTPDLLLRSGIGPAEAIEAVGLAVVQPLAGVGRNFQDHAIIALRYAAGPALRDDHHIPKLRIIARSDPTRVAGDLHLLVHPPTRGPDGRLRLTVSVRLLEHRARGRVWLGSADPDALPLVDPALARDPGDVAALVAGIELVDRLVAQAPLARFVGERLDPPPGADLADAVRTRVSSYNHAVGTARLGRPDDPLAVVGPDLGVHGLGGLVVADASVLPVIPHNPTNLAAILVGEIAAAGLAAG